MTDGKRDANADIPLVGRDSEAAGSGDVMADRVAALRQLFPEADADGAINVDVLRQLLGEAVEAGEERYGLHWRGKARARALALTPSTGTLRPAPADSVDWDTTGNIVIEGDNLEVLKLIRRAYAGKVKLIYIDPPYNTGGDFVYPDDYRDPLSAYLELTGQTDAEGRRMTSNKEASGRFHTAWLNMMYPRLMLAKELLQQDGFIAVSIDHNELAGLRACMDEVFGVGNFKNQIILRRGIKNVQAQFDDIDSLSAGHEYIVLFARSASARLSKLSVALKDFQSGKWDTFWRGTNRPTMRYELFGHTPDTGQWRWSKDRTDEAVANHARFLSSESSESDIDDYYLSHLQATNEELFFVRLNDEGVVQYFVPPTGTKLLSNNWMDVSLKGAETSTFDTEKHVDLLRRLVDWIVPDEGLILDFFAGSGTTGHAVMAQNAADGGKRRFILVQLPEPLDPAKADQKTAADFCDTLRKPRTIAELTKERLRRAGDKVRGDNPDATVDTGFRVFRLDTSNLKPWNPETDDLQGALLDAIDNVLVGRSEEDLLTELLLKTGVDLSMPSERREIAGRTVHALGGGVLMVCLGAIGRDDAEALGQGMCDWREALAPVRPTTFWFRDSGFADAATRANLAAIIRQRLGTQVEKLGAI